MSEKTTEDEADIQSLMRSLSFSREEAETIVRQTNAEVERVLALSDEQVIAECKAEGDDPEKVALRVRGIFERAKSEADRRARMRWREKLAHGIDESLRRQRRILRRVIQTPSFTDCW